VKLIIFIQKDLCAAATVCHNEFQIGA